MLKLALSLQVIYALLGIVHGCEENKPCTLASGGTGLCLLSVCHQSISEEPRENLSFGITVRYPDYMLHDANKTKLYIRGNGLGLSWDKGTLLTKMNESTWQIVITYKWSMDRFECQDCNQNDRVYLQGNKLQYRIFLNDQKDMLGANFAISFPLSKTSLYFASHPEFVVYPWFNEFSGSLHTFRVLSDILGQTRELVIFTPPSFVENQYKIYPALIVFDLNKDFANFVKRILEMPILRSVAEEYILLGFGDFNDEEREHLLSPSPSPFLGCKNGTHYDRCGGCIPDGVNDTEYLRYLLGGCGKRIMFRGDGEKTLDFLITEVLPVAGRILNFRIDEKRLGVMGYSLGGLLSCHAAWTRPHVFSFAACQSPSFWWPLKNDSLSEPLFQFINETLKDPTLLVNRTQQRFYIDGGGAETDPPFNMAQSAIEVGQIISSFDHYTLDRNVWINIIPSKQHNFIEWIKRIGQAISILLPASGETGMPVPVTNQAFLLNSSLLLLSLVLTLKVV